MKKEIREELKNLCNYAIVWHNATESGLAGYQGYNNTDRIVFDPISEGEAIAVYIDEEGKSIVINNQEYQKFILDYFEGEYKGYKILFDFPIEEEVEEEEVKYIKAKLKEMGKHFATHDGADYCCLEKDGFDYTKVMSHPISVENALRYYKDCDAVQELLNY